MSKIICTSAIDGAVEWIARAEAKCDEAIQLKGETFPVSFPNTAYYLPVIYSLTGIKVTDLDSARYLE